MRRTSRRAAPRVYVSTVFLDRLPLFPLPLVLFPAATLPLHIFEPRYRSMLADCLEGDRRFGIVRLPEGLAESEIAIGTVGCVAEIAHTRALPDGRSNIIVHGGERFAFAAFVPSANAYHVCRGQPYADDDRFEPDLDDLAGRVRDVFKRVAQAARTLADDPESVPDLPDDPALLSFAIASLIDLDIDTRQEILTSRSPIERLQRIDAVLAPALATLIGRAEVHKVAKTNGRGAHPQP